MPLVTDVLPLFGPADLLRESRRRLPELAHELDGCASVSVVVRADAVACETLAWARDADAADHDVVQRIAAFWADVLGRDGVHPEVRNAVTAAHTLFEARSIPYVE